MKHPSLLAALLLCAAWIVPGRAAADPPPCHKGAYDAGADGILVIAESTAVPSAGERYILLDGRRGALADPDAPVRCAAGVVHYRAMDGTTRALSLIPMRETETHFDSAATRLAGRLIEPAGPPDRNRPLVVLVHGSERTRAVAAIYGHMLAAQGISVFAYDKRGTGASEGEYTQNFELLADDAAAALAEARRLAAGRFGRSGYFGGSQGGWIAPLAATRSKADFVAVGFGLVVSPIEEDHEQLLDEARALHLDDRQTALVERLSQATAGVMRSHFSAGFDALERVKREIGDEPWARTIAGEYSGAMLRMPSADLKRIGRARFDNLEVIWNYDSQRVLRSLHVPLLWVLAEQDREAPIFATRAALSKLRASGRPIDLYLFPDTDHGMVEYRTKADGSRTPTRITDGYLKLLADWIKGDVAGSYGRGRRVD